MHDRKGSLNSCSKHARIMDCFISNSFLILGFCLSHILCPAYGQTNPATSPSQEQDQRVRLLKGAGLTYGAEISEATYDQLRKVIGSFSKALNFMLRTPPKNHVLIANVSSAKLSACDKGDWRVVTLKETSPNVIILDQPDLKVAQLPNSPDKPDTINCAFDLGSDYLWAEAYFWTSVPKPSPPSSTPLASSPPSPPPLPPAPGPIPGTGMWFEKKFPAFTQPGAINAQFKYSPGFGSADQSSATVAIDPYWRVNLVKGWFGSSVVYNFDSRPAKNPDALLAAWTYAFRFARPTWFTLGGSAGHQVSARGQIRPCAINGKPAALEYAPRHGDLDFIAGLACGIPFVVDLLHQPSWLTFTPTFGIETGANLETAGNLGTPSFIFRGVPGADASIRWLWPAVFGSKPLTLVAKYRARIPVRDETFTDATNASSSKPLPPPILTTRTRHYAEAQASYPISKALSVGLVYQYGSLPPAFVNFGHNLQLTIKAVSPGDYEH